MCAAISSTSSLFARLCHAPEPDYRYCYAKLTGRSLDVCPECSARAHALHRALITWCATASTPSESSMNPDPLTSNTDSRASRGAPVEIARPKAVDRLMKHVASPVYCVRCAGFSSLELAESDPSRTLRILSARTSHTHFDSVLIAHRLRSGLAQSILNQVQTALTLCQCGPIAPSVLR